MLFSYISNIVEQAKYCWTVYQIDLRNASDTIPCLEKEIKVDLQKGENVWKPKKQYVKMFQTQIFSATIDPELDQSCEDSLNIDLRRATDNLQKDQI